MKANIKKCECFTCTNVYILRASNACRRGCQTYWNWNYRQVWVVWVLKTKLSSSARATSYNRWAISWSSFVAGSICPRQQEHLTLTLEVSERYCQPSRLVWVTRSVYKISFTVRILFLNGFQMYHSRSILLNAPTSKSEGVALVLTVNWQSFLQLLVHIISDYQAHFPQHVFQITNINLFPFRKMQIFNR